MPKLMVAGKTVFKLFLTYILKVYKMFREAANKKAFFTKREGAG